MTSEKCNPDHKGLGNVTLSTPRLLCIGHCSQKHLTYWKPQTTKSKVHLPLWLSPLPPSPVSLNVSLSLSGSLSHQSFHVASVLVGMYAREHCRCQSWPVQIKKCHMPLGKKMCETDWEIREKKRLITVKMGMCPTHIIQREITT